MQVCHHLRKFSSTNLTLQQSEPKLPRKTGINKLQMESVKTKKATKMVAYKQL